MAVFQYPIQFANIALALLGFILIWAGPYICYRTIIGVRKARKADPKASLHVFNNGLNLLIGVCFFFAGILFVVNNLRGNPLA
jgi:hypothetical protein